MYKNGVPRGRKCNVCVGCGRCPAGRGGKNPAAFRIVTDSLSDSERVDLSNEGGLRLAAVDVGTTTIAMELYEADGRVCDRFVQVNPQVRFGADVLSRITAAGDPQTAEELKTDVRGVLIKGLEHFLQSLKDGERLVAVVAANTTMNYLLMGWDPGEIGVAPFHATHLEGVCTTFELHSKESIPVYLLPGYSAFVGGDLLAGVYFCGLAERSEITLLIDLGTNGEMVLGNRERMMGCATAAGPAFEGGAGRGIWGADLVKYTAELLDSGLLDETGLLAEEVFESGARVGDVVLTGETIRALQCAKAAIMAGIGVLTKEYGISLDRIQRCVLAGGFGYYLNPSDAVRIGLLPGKLLGCTLAGGNTALAGAKRAGGKILKMISSGEKVDFSFLPVERMTILNLAMQEEFSKRYIDAMSLAPGEQ